MQSDLTVSRDALKNNLPFGPFYVYICPLGTNCFVTKNYCAYQHVDMNVFRLYGNGVTLKKQIVCLH
jgi:hypothetical protein